MKISRFNSMIFLGIALAALILLQGCGASGKLESAPDGSTITFDPSSFAITSPATVCVSPINVVLRYPDGTPFPRGVVNISGGFAVPNVDTATVTAGGLYQFFYLPNCTGAAMSSGYQAQTDVKGVYSFSALIPGTISGPTITTLLNSFTDKLVATSGTAVGQADFNFN